MEMANAVRQYYMTIYSTVFDAAGNFLAAGNSYGTMAVYNLIPIFERDEDDDPGVEIDRSLTVPFYQFSAHREAIYSMVSTRELVISGSAGEITAWDWISLKTQDYEEMWCLKLESRHCFTKMEVNSLALCDGDDNIVYAGCGDNNIYGININAGRVMFTLSGHTDYIHCVIANGLNGCISGSEDGSLRLWDARRGGREINLIEPYKLRAIRRPEVGKWIGCAAVDSTNKWLVCGGGPSLCMWNLPTLLPISMLHKDDITSSVVHFCGNSIISGGAEPCLNFWTLNTDLTNMIPVSPSHVFGIGICPAEDRKLLSVSGCSYKIELFSASRERECSLIFPV